MVLVTESSNLKLIKLSPLGPASAVKVVKPLIWKEVGLGQAERAARGEERARGRRARMGRVRCILERCLGNWFLGYFLVVIS